MLSASDFHQYEVEETKEDHHQPATYEPHRAFRYTAEEERRYTDMNDAQSKDQESVNPVEGFHGDLTNPKI